MTVVAVGKSSFLARAVRERNDPEWIFLSHEEALRGQAWLDGARCVVNFAFPPQFKKAGYDADLDIDSRLARLIAGRPVHYVMLSSRLVYGRAPDNFGLTEDAPSAPEGPYAAAKMKIEESLRSLIPGNLTILRIANIFGFEYGRETFFGRAMTDLSGKKTITLDIDPSVRRDFLAAWRFADALATIARKPVAGVFNLGSGFGTECGKAAQWLIEGYGQGRVAVSATAANDQFWLDMARTRAAYGLPAATPETLERDCVSCGRWLKDRNL